MKHLVIPGQHTDACHRQIGTATLYLGDARDIFPGLPDASVNMLWTDPPYGYENAAKGDFLHRREHIMKKGGAGKVKPIANDDAESARGLVEMMLRESTRLLLPTGTVACCCGGGSGTLFSWLVQRMDADGLKFFHSVIWDKCNPGIGWRYRRQHEMVIVGHRADGSIGWNPDAKALANIIRVPKPGNGFHPNEKPTMLIAPMLFAHTVPGDMVLDPFMGSGTTGIVAVQQGFRFIGIESDPAHFEVACQRLEDAQQQDRIPNPARSYSHDQHIASA